ncbi:MAG TPA: RNA methyltransferase [Anaerolineaceae bacterium]|nr:RNA methyltransferase [Anaerolineaceae bacterium]
MPARSTNFRQCIREDCRFRYPAPANLTAHPCPRCGSPTQVASGPQESLEWNPRDIHPSGPVVEALLDNIRSSYNVGSMFRSADGAGIQRLHLAGTTPTPEHPGVAKTALGAEFAVPWSHSPNGVDAAARLKEKGFQLWALEVGPQSIPLFESLPAAGDPPIVLVVGNEVSGIDPGILARCDRFLWIPMQGYKRSLNVASAFGIAAYFLTYGDLIQTALAPHSNRPPAS